MRVVLCGNHEVTNYFEGTIRDRESPEDLREKNRVARHKTILDLFSQAFEIQVSQIFEAVDDGPVQK